MDDITAISQLVLRERLARDRGDWDTMRAAWDPDGRVRVSWVDGTATEFINGSIAMARGGTSATHRMSPPVVDVAGDRAVAVAPAVIEVRALLGGVEVDLASRTRLVFRVERQEESWRLVAMTCVYETDAITPVEPGAHPDLTAVALNDRRASYRWLATVLGAAGHTIGDDLPGEDRPETTRAVDSAGREWISSCSAVAA